MEQTIAHSRLKAFFGSKVINSLMIVVLTGVFLYKGSGGIPAPVVASAAALLLAVGYSVWLLVARPASMVVNRQLSRFNGLLMVYFFIVANVRSETSLWYIFPVVCAVLMMFVTLIRDTDETVTF